MDFRLRRERLKADCRLLMGGEDSNCIGAVDLVRRFGAFFPCCVSTTVLPEIVAKAGMGGRVLALK